jgi:hypothetical protein
MIYLKVSADFDYGTLGEYYIYLNSHTVRNLDGAIQVYGREIGPDGRLFSWNRITIDFRKDCWKFISIVTDDEAYPDWQDRG